SMYRTACSSFRNQNVCYDGSRQSTLSTNGNPAYRHFEEGDTGAQQMVGLRPLRAPFLFPYMAAKMGTAPSSFLDEEHLCIRKRPQSSQNSHSITFALSKVA